jgi:hypothetical protein
VALALTGDPSTESRADSSAIDSTLMGASSTSSFAAAAARAEGRRHERSTLRLELLDLELLTTPSRLMAGAGAGREPSREVEASDLGSDLGDAWGEGDGGDGGAVGVVFSSDNASLSNMSSLVCFSTAIIASFPSSTSPGRSMMANRTAMAAMSLLGAMPRVLRLLRLVLIALVAPVRDAGCAIVPSHAGGAGFGSHGNVAGDNHGPTAAAGATI